MNIKQVDYFITVADHGSFSSAAREHGISVQAMSKAMTDLENEFGERLFERSHQGVALTELGETFREKAAPVVGAFHELEHMGEPQAIGHAKLKIFLCAPAFLRNARARANMAAFFDKYLGTETEVSIGAPEDGIASIRSGGCDALITIGPYHHPDFDCFSAGTVPAGVCMAKNHPLADRSAVSLRDLAPFPVISSKRFDHFNDSILVIYQRNGLLSPAVEPSYYDMPRQFYLKHAFAFMVNISALGEMLPRSVMKPIAAEDVKAIPLCLVTLKGEKSPAYQRLEHLLRTRT